jgi:hypothetical protein
MTSMPAIFVVLQSGGSSSEHYFHSFDNEGVATRYVENAEAQGYQCIGPERLELGEVANLMIASRKLLIQLQRKGYEELDAVPVLEAALSEIEQKLC